VRGAVHRLRWSLGIRPCASSRWMSCRRTWPRSRAGCSPPHARFGRDRDPE
jgi:hypothetical protein